MTGAVCLAAEAAFRADAGYVAVAAPRESLPVIETRVLEAVKRAARGGLRTRSERASALAIGPGPRPGSDERARRSSARLLDETDLPAVVDADGLHGLEPFERDGADAC